MRRRSFLSMLGASALVPALPARAVVPSVAAAGYNRYMYGVAVFHARTRASLTAADLMAKLRIGAGTAEAMLGEMKASGVIAPALQAASGAMRTLNPHHVSGIQKTRLLAGRAGEWVGDILEAQETALEDENPAVESGEINQVSPPENLNN